MLIASLTGNPIAIAGVTAAMFLPWAAGPFLGAVVDRRDRRTLIVVAQLLRGGAVLALAILAWRGAVTPAIVYVIAFALGVGEVVVDTVIQAAVPRLTGERSLELTNARVQVADTIANRVAGPPLGALLFAVAASLPFVVDGLSFVIAAFLLLTLRTPLQDERDLTAVTMADDVKEGIRHLGRDPVLRPMLVLLVVANAAVQIYTAVFVLFNRDVLGGDARQFGILLAVAAVGGIVGGVGAPFVAARVARPVLLVAAPLLTAASLLLVAAVPELPTVVVGTVLSNVGGALFNVSTASLRQLVTPPDLLGRVSSSFRAVVLAGFPVGAVAGGVIADSAGLVATFFVGGVLFVFVALGMLRVGRRMPAELHLTPAS